MVPFSRMYGAPGPVRTLPPLPAPGKGAPIGTKISGDCPGPGPNRIVMEQFWKQFRRMEVRFQKETHTHREHLAQYLAIFGLGCPTFTRFDAMSPSPSVSFLGLGCEFWCSGVRVQDSTLELDLRSPDSGLRQPDSGLRQSRWHVCPHGETPDPHSTRGGRQTWPHGSTLDTSSRVRP